MKIFLILLLVSFASVVRAQNAPPTDSAEAAIVAAAPDTMSSANTLHASPGAIGHCVMLPWDLPRCRASRYDGPDCYHGYSRYDREEREESHECHEQHECQAHHECGDGLAVFERIFHARPLSE